MNTSTKNTIQWLGKTLTIISIIFIFRSVFRLELDFFGIRNLPIFMVVFLTGVIIKTITVFLSGRVWGNWISFFARRRCNPVETLCVYTKANIGKYLPGNVMQYVERNLFAERMNVKQAEVAFSSMMEVLSLVCVAFVIGMLTSMDRLSLAIYQIFVRLESSGYIVILFAILLIILLCIVAFILLRKKISTIHSTMSFTAFLRCAVRNAFGQAVVLFFLGAIYAMLYSIMGDGISLTQLRLIIGGYTISWVLGFIVPGAPGGIGIREYVAQLLIEPLIGAELTLTISLIHRLITIIGDFAAYLLGILISYRNNKGSFK